MELLAIAKLAPMIMSGVSILKRFIPDEQRKVVNPIVACVTGIIGAWQMGGIEGVTPILLTGLTGAVIAMAGYSLPKAAGKKMGIK